MMEKRKPAFSGDGDHRKTFPMKRILLETMTLGRWVNGVMFSTRFSKKEGQTAARWALQGEISHNRRRGGG